MFKLYRERLKIDKIEINEDFGRGNGRRWESKCVGNIRGNGGNVRKICN